MSLNNRKLTDACSDDDVSSVESYCTAYSPDDMNTEDSKINKIKVSPLLPHEQQYLNKISERVVFLQEYNKDYRTAINDIRSQNAISIIIEPNFYGRHCTLAVLVISTGSHVYIFDQLAMAGFIHGELKTILGAPFPTKIMHYSHRISDLLLHKNDIQLNGICDTFVAMCVVRRDRSLCTLPDAISQVLDIPRSELTCPELQSTSFFVRSFSRRPLSATQMSYLAKMAILQHKLYDRLINDYICIGLQKMTKEFSGVFANEEDSSTVALNMHPNSKSGFEAINEFYLEGF